MFVGGPLPPPLLPGSVDGLPPPWDESVPVWAHATVRGELLLLGEVEEGAGGGEGGGHDGFLFNVTKEKLRRGLRVFWVSLQEQLDIHI